MNKITFPLKQGMQGPAVVDLQVALQVLLDRAVLLGDNEPARREMSALLQRERAGQTYGNATGRLVSAYQEERRLRASGEVDEPTTKSLNALLTEWGLLDRTDAAQSYVVSGKVRREDGLPVHGVRVRASHESDRGGIRLGEDGTDPTGGYTIRYELLPGVDGINLRLSVTDEEGRLLQSSNVIRGAKPLEILDLVAPIVDRAMFQVQGKVASRVSAGVGGLRVRIVDKTVGDDVQLAEALTDEGGGFQATFPSADVRRRGKQQPDLQARAFAGDTFLAASDVRYNASIHETLNIMLDDAAASALQSEHETLRGALAGHFKGKLADLKETDERHDITYLANKTGWDARAVALAALADQFSARTADGGGNAAIAPAFFYALFRAGLPASEDTLYAADGDTLKAIWGKAAEQGVIPRNLMSAIPGVVTRFQSLSAQKLLTGPALVGASSLKEMLTASRIDDARQQQFAALYAAHRGNMPKLWDEVTNAFGADTAKRLQVDGKLAFLTINNAPLMQKLHSAAGNNGLSDPLQLAQLGYHRATKWNTLLTSSVPIPKEIPGDTPTTKLANYAEYLAAQVRLSYPTAAVAEMVRSGDLAVAVPDQVHAFLTEHQGKFEIGTQPVQRYIARNNLQVAKETVTQVKRLQRIYQITPSDQAMIGLLKRGIDAAYHVTRYEKAAFVQTFAKELGGDQSAEETYDKSVQVYNAVLNVAISYITARNAPGIGVHSPAQIVDPTPTNAGDVIAYGTLETLFGEMDFCACDHCRSILSPAAYLVDLLMFIDNPERPANTENPLTVLLERRPEIEQLPLTCENTNTTLPYIDLVNETLEYFIANDTLKLSLNNYVGHDTNGIASEDLLASPQFVMDSAYTTLRGERFPVPLPFHQPLEGLRRYFDKFEVRLPLAMERLRKSDVLEVDRTTNPPPPPTDYGWRDILMEEIGLSREEHEILTNTPSPVPLWLGYGFASGTAEADVTAALSNAKQFARRVGITYEEIVAILRTQFINPNSDLIPKLERLGVPFAEIKKLKDANTPAADAAFIARLPTGARAPDPAEYGGDIITWLKNGANYARIMGLITLTDPTASPDPCTFVNLEFRYARPMTALGDLTTRLGAVEFVRLLRFIRLWKKLGWTIEQTDAAICALLPVPAFPLGADAIDTVAKLDAGFLTLLPRLGVVVRVMMALNLTPKRDLLPLLGCWSEIGTHGASALYRQMFLNPVLLNQDPVFADNGFGEFLPPPATDLADHAEALRSAFNLTGDEFDRITASLHYDADTPLTIRNMSAVYRRGWLARKLKLSVREFLLLTSFSGLDPFAAPDPTDPAILQLVSLVQALKDRSLKSAAALYLIWNQDLNGKSAPDPSQVTELARTLRGDFAAIEEQFTAAEDPVGDIARARMTLVYGQEAADAFFALLDDTIVLDAAYAHPISTLQPAIIAADDKIAYDDFRHQLSHTGVLSAATQVALKAVAGVTTAFKTAVDMLFARSEDARGSFFARYRELEPLYNATMALDLTLVPDVAYIHPAATLEAAITAADSNIAYDNIQHQLSYSGVLTAVHRDRLKGVPGVTAAFQGAVDALFARSEEAKGAVLAALRPELSRRRKRQQALQRLSAAPAVDLAFSQALLDPPNAPGEAFPLHASGHADQPVLNDVLAVETPGLAAKFFFRDTATGAVDLAVPNATNLDYARGSGNPLPENPTPGTAISGIWQGQVEAPEAGFYNFVVEVDTGATVGLTLGGQARPLTQNDNVRRNTDSIELKGGTLYEIVLTVETVKETLKVKWETPKRPREVIPSRYFYPPTILAPFADAYIRFLKVASLADGLGLSAKEMGHFGTHSDYRIGGDGWLNALPVTGDPASPTGVALLKPLQAILDCARIKAAISPGDERLLSVLKDPVLATANTGSLLFTITGWDALSLNAVLTQFGGIIADLTQFELFRRVYDAFALMQTMGISATALIHVTTNEATGDTVRDLQASLRARYAAADWRDVVQPINDALRSLQRDALVAYVLHQMGSKSASKHIDTAEKLFEYFLMDVQMEPCMQTSRIRHALSSVQLFVERCLMNLEPRVSPGSINPKQWEWMKRYRVWEANRKVFLFPENWLEPELRDDKSPFFKEIESELLQSDITEESATTALLNYLSNLEEVAKLEPCGIYHVENNEALRTGEIDHVIARTAGANRKYYYRRHEGYWTPWEPIKLDIEDNPVIPVVWKGRLLLFWLRILKQAPDAALQAPSDKLILTSGMKASDVVTSTPLNVSVRAVLCWSEYHNGKWQASKTSDVNRPVEVSSFLSAGPTAFDRTQLKLRSSDQDSGELQIYVGYPGADWSCFRLYNTHSLPVPMRWADNAFWSPEFTSLIKAEIHQILLPMNQLALEGAVTSVLDPILTRIIMEINVGIRKTNLREIEVKFTPLIGSAIRGRFSGGLGQALSATIQPKLPEMLWRLLKPYLLKSRDLEFKNDALVSKYYDPFVTKQPFLAHSILTSPLPKSVVESRHPLNEPSAAPFFYEDSRHVFFVTTTEQQVQIGNHRGYTIELESNIEMAPKLPHLVIKADPHNEAGNKFWGDGTYFGVSEPAAVNRFVTEDAYIRRAIGTTGIVKYGDRQIGPAGMVAEVQTNIKR
jgi:hypothetical protein